MTIVVLDLGVSNVRSLVRAFERIGVEPEVTSQVSAVEHASVIVLPGVGAFRDGMAALHERGLVEPIRRAVLGHGAFAVGICLGMQLLAEESEENGRHEGLGLIRGRVVRLHSAGGDRVPNIGWCDVRAERASSVLPPEVDGLPMYFVHSYHVECADAADAVASIEHGERRVTVALEKANVIGVQFHPEKSQDAGLTVLAAVARLGAVEVAR